jgi:hypothetical protein
LRPVRSFNEIVCQAIDKTLEELIGPQVVKSLYSHLSEKFGVDRNELPYRIDTICSVLEGVFGVKGARIIERKVARNLYDKLLLPFNDEQGSRLEDFLAAARHTISADNYYV